MRFLRFMSTDISVSTKISVTIVISRLIELHVAVRMMFSGKGGLVRIRPYNLVGLIGSNIGDVMMMMCLVLSNDRL
jgi:hypothetical protein